jgi:hypothetical protein
MCIMWKIRQRELGIDDFGNPLEDAQPGLPDSPIPIIQGPPNGEQVPEAVSVVVESDIHESHEAHVSEQTPLLKQHMSDEQGKGWLSWLRG